jgi:hypothetical protein
MLAAVKSMGGAPGVILALALLCWAAMMASILTWIGREPKPGREVRRVIRQACSGGAAVILWILLAALFLVANSHRVIPAPVGILAWLVLPLSCAGAVAAIFLLYDPPRHWPVIVPAAAPLLISAYVIYAFSPTTQVFSAAGVGLALWAVVAALSALVLARFRPFLKAHGGGYTTATSGPELERFQAEERARRRANDLEELSRMDDETSLYEVKTYMHPASVVRPEAVEIARHLPNRQAEMIVMLRNQHWEPLWFIAEIDIRPTPELCEAARCWLHGTVRDRHESSGTDFIGDEFTQNLVGIAWIAANCGCEKELDEIEAYVRRQNPNAPAVQKFLADLAAIREKK